MSDSDLVHLKIDGVSVEVKQGATLIEAISEIDLETPVICYHEATTPKGLCRVCVVEVEGWRTLAPACITQVADGMQIKTGGTRVNRARRTILEMLNSAVDLTEAPEIQQQMAKFDVDRERFPEANKREFELLDDNPFYIRDYEKCLLCWRCVQACADDLQFTYALSVGGRGYKSKITTFFEAPLPETTCVFCGNCIGVCPTGALKFKTEHYLEQGLDYDEIRVKKKAERRKRKVRDKSDE